MSERYSVRYVSVEPAVDKYLINSVVLKPSGKFGQAYCGCCEAYPGIPTGSGNKQ